jgi:predicted nuclease of predicted toxin-antitoxin system
MSKAIRLFLDQMIQKHVADVLAQEGYDVVRASEVGQSRADDRAILENAILEQRILITLDDHFGDWAVLPLNKHPGVIRLKVNPTTSQNILALIKPFLQRIDPEKIANHLIILSSTKEKWISTSS